MDRIRLCIITPEFLPVWGGLGTYTVELVKHMPDDAEIHVGIHVVTSMRETFGKADYPERALYWAILLSGVEFVSNLPSSV